MDEYRRNAGECQRMADKTGNAMDKASWLRLAASWLGMIKTEPKRPFENKTGQETPEKSSGQWPNPSDDDSQASH